MRIEEQIFEIASEINNIQNKIDSIHQLDYQMLHQYTDGLFELKRRLQILENKSYLERKPDLEGDEIDLYLKNLHDLRESSPDKFSYIITLHGTKTKIGVMDVRFSLLETEKYLGNIGAEIDAEHRGKRYAKKAFSLLKDTMLEYGLKRPIFTVRVDNYSSIKSLDTIGAKRVELVSDAEFPYYVYEYDLEKEKSSKR